MKIWYYTSSEHILRKPDTEVLGKDKKENGMGNRQTRPIMYCLVVVLTPRTHHATVDEKRYSLSLSGCISYVIPISVDSSPCDSRGTELAILTMF